MLKPCAFFSNFFNPLFAQEHFKARDFEDHHEADQQSVNAEGFDKSQTEDQVGLDFAGRFGVTRYAGQSGVNGIAHAEPGAESGNTNGKTASQSQAEKDPHAGRLDRRVGGHGRKGCSQDQQCCQNPFYISLHCSSLLEDIILLLILTVNKHE